MVNNVEKAEKSDINGSILNSKIYRLKGKIKIQGVREKRH